MLDGKAKTHDIYRDILRDHVAATEDGLENRGHVAGAYLAEMSRRSAGSEGSFTEVQCLHALADLFGAGLDTTLATLRWFLVFVASHPDVQERVQIELDAAVSARGGDSPQMSDAPLCQFTEAALAETQRLRSVVPVGIPHGAVQVRCPPVPH